MLLVFLKWHYLGAEVESLDWILSPVETLSGWMTGTSYHWLPEKGYFEATQQILIDKSCAGINFLIIACSLVVFSFLPYTTTLLQKIWTFLALLILTYLVTLLANASRIATASTLLRFDEQFPIVKTASFHQFVGILCYFVALVILYTSLKYWFESKQNHER